MIRGLKPNERLAQVGFTALRAPDGSFLPSVPMFVIVDAGKVNEKTGFSEGEEETMTDFAGIMARKFKQYVDGVAAL